MKKVRALIKSGRFLVPVTAVLEDRGVLVILPKAGVSEYFRVRGSLSPAEISNFTSSRVELVLEDRECEFSMRKTWRKMEILDKTDKELLGYLGVDYGSVMKEGSQFYNELYLVKLIMNRREHTFIVNRRSAVLLKNYFSRYCASPEAP